MRWFHEIFAKKALNKVNFRNFHSVNSESFRFSIMQKFREINANRYTYL